MKRTKHIVTALVALLLAASAGAQDEEPREEPARPVEPTRPDPLPPVGERETDAMQELKDLFLEVERKLAKIDDDLADAGAGAMPLDAVADAGLDDLLRQTSANSMTVQLKIDRILEIAKKMNQGGAGGGGQGKGKPSPGGESPLDQPRDTGPQKRENTPEASKPSPDEKPSDAKGGENPKEGNQQDRADGENRSGDPRVDPPGAPVPAGDEAEEWGFLPERYRDVFRNQGREDLPVQYRDWIDAYYRRLNRSGRSGSSSR